MYVEILKYRKRKREFEFRLKISHAAFRDADALGKRKLIVAELLRSVGEMRRLGPPSVRYDDLERDVHGVAAARGWL